jgi:hypothetical protein
MAPLKMVCAFIIPISYLMDSFDHEVPNKGIAMYVYLVYAYTLQYKSRIRLHSKLLKQYFYAGAVAAEGAAVSHSNSVRFIQRLYTVQYSTVQYSIAPTNRYGQKDI